MGFDTIEINLVFDKNLFFVIIIDQSFPIDNFLPNICFTKKIWTKKMFRLKIIFDENFFLP